MAKLTKEQKEQAKYIRLKLKGLTPKEKFKLIRQGNKGVQKLIDDAKDALKEIEEED